MILSLLIFLAVQPAYGEEEGPFPPRPIRLDPAAGDMDAKGYADKVPFYQGRPVLIAATGEPPEVLPFEVKANGILVAPSYLAFLEKTLAWSEGAERYLSIQQAEHADQVARVEWMLSQKNAELEAERKPLPLFQREWVHYTAGALVATGAILTAGWALGQVENGR